MDGTLGPIRNSIFGSFTVNFGPRTICLPHRDTENLGFGWCTVTALGNYDHQRGGHLVLWDLRVVLEFPPGSTALIPSAVVCHSNTAVGKQETRYSFAMYTHHGLFQYFDRETNGAHMGGKEERWKWGTKLFSTLEELKKGSFEDKIKELFPNLSGGDKSYFL
jgi:hypothetical protein